MEVVCAWCHSPLDGTPDDGRPDQPVSHGICEPCVTKLFAGTRQPLDRFLDLLAAPVLLVDDDGRVLTANRQACHVLRWSRESFEGVRFGDVIQCVQAAKPGGCGRQVQCQSCAIRQTVNQTVRTGLAALDVPARKDTGDCDAPTPVAFRISTELVGGLVLLRIDDLRRGEGVELLGTGEASPMPPAL